VHPERSVQLPELLATGPAREVAASASGAVCGPIGYGAMSSLPLHLGFAAAFAAVALTAASLQDLELRRVETQQVADALALRSVAIGTLSERVLAVELDQFWSRDFVPAALEASSQDGGITHRLRFCRLVQPWALAWLDSSLTRVQVCVESLAREIGFGAN